MTRETALALTAELDEANISYSMGMSYLDQMLPAKNYRVQVWFRELTSERLRELEEIVEPFDISVHFGIGSRELDLWENARARRIT